MKSYVAMNSRAWPTRLPWLPMCWGSLVPSEQTNGETIMSGTGLVMSKNTGMGTRRGGLKRFGTQNMLPLFIIAMAVVATAIEPKFATVDNLLNLARQIMPLLILATGQAFAIISGGLDLSLADRKSTRLNSSHVAI